MTHDEFSARVTAMMQTLYRVSYSLLYRACDREDAVSECLLKAWKHKDKLRDERYMQTWMVRILLNECYAILRQQKTVLPLDEAMVRTEPENCCAELHDALLTLKDELRIPVVLHYIEGFSVKEIAKILHLPVSTINNRLYRGRQKLKEQLDGEVLVTC